MKECFLLYFPLKVAIIDDDKDFLNFIAQNISRKDTFLYSCPDRALIDIKSVDFQVKTLTKESHDGIYDLSYTNIRKCYEDNANYFGVLISDYRMPKIDGIELLSIFKDTDILKILLTGEFKIESAVDALNTKTIDYYLPKDKINSIEEIINTLEVSLFRKIAKEVTKNVEDDALFFLKDINYITIFNETCDRYNIIKYCLLNSYGGYLLENEKEKFYLTIFHKKYRDEISEGFSDTERKKINSGELIPSIFSQSQNTLLPAQTWFDYSFCIEKIY